MAPSHPITGSLHVPSLDTSRGSLPIDRGDVDTEVSVSSTGMVTPSSACQLVQGSGQLANTQVDPVYLFIYLLVYDNTSIKVMRYDDLKDYIYMCIL